MSFIDKLSLDTTHCTLIPTHFINEDHFSEVQKLKAPYTLMPENSAVFLFEVSLFIGNRNKTYFAFKTEKVCKYIRRKNTFFVLFFLCVNTH